MVFCLENSLFIISCSIIIFTVNGNYTQWTDWSTCSHSCGPGFMLRSRTCTNPSPSNGGLDCTRLGRPVQSTQCYLVDCPGDAGYTVIILFVLFLSFIVFSALSLQHRLLHDEIYCWSRFSFSPVALLANNLGRFISDA